MQTHRLVYDRDADLSRVPQFVFGHMVQLAATVVESYHSDLYWDAEWLRGRLTGDGPLVFWWGCSKAGTYIGTGEPTTPNYPDLQLYWFELRKDGNWLDLLIWPADINSAKEKAA